MSSAGSRTIQPRDFKEELITTLIKLESTPISSNIYIDQISVEILYYIFIFIAYLKHVDFEGFACLLLRKSRAIRLILMFLRVLILIAHAHGAHQAFHSSEVGKLVPASDVGERSFHFLLISNFRSCFSFFKYQRR